MKSHRMKSLSGGLIGLILILSNSCSPHDYSCTLKGTIVDRTSDTLMLKKATDDWRFVTIFIPIINGKFEYKMEVKANEAWKMAFRDEYLTGSFRPISFFPDSKEVRFELYPRKQFDKNKITGGRQNRALSAFEFKKKETFDPRLLPLTKIRDSLRENDLYYSKEMAELIAVLKSSKSNTNRDSIIRQLDNLTLSGKDLTPESIENENHIDLVYKEMAKYRSDFISNNIDILTYSFVMEYALNSGDDEAVVKEIRDVYPVFAKKYPEHPYTSLISEILNGLGQIKVGGHFIDFTLPDLNGSKQTLSELIKGKVAVINLWATWCGPCIRHSREMVPLYNEYFDKGFTIVGVAAEVKNTKAMKKRLEQEKWAWINLVELDHQNQIWDKYGASFSGGKIILVDKNGVILAINPTAEETRQKLEQIL